MSFGDLSPIQDCSNICKKLIVKDAASYNNYISDIINSYYGRNINDEEKRQMQFTENQQQQAKNLMEKYQNDPSYQYTWSKVCSLVQKNKYKIIMPSNSETHTNTSFIYQTPAKYLLHPKNEVEILKEESSFNKKINFEEYDEPNYLRTCKRLETLSPICKEDIDEEIIEPCLFQFTQDFVPPHDETMMMSQAAVDVIPSSPIESQIPNSVMCSQTVLEDRGNNSISDSDTIVYEQISQDNISSDTSDDFQDSVERALRLSSEYKNKEKKQLRLLDTSILNRKHNKRELVEQSIHIMDFESNLEQIYYKKFHQWIQQKVLGLFKCSALKVSLGSISKMISKLRQACNNPLWINENFKDNNLDMDDFFDNLRKDVSKSFDHKKRHRCTKVNKLCEMIQNLSARKKNATFLIISEWSSFLDMIELALDDVGISFSRLDDAMTSKERERCMKRFNNRQSICALLVPVSSFGFCLSQTNPSNVFIMEPNVDLNNLRILLANQNIKVIRFIVRNTIEHRILQLQEDKPQLVRNVLDKTNQDQKVFKSDMIQLLSLTNDK